MGGITSSQAEERDGDLAEHEAEELGQPPRLREDSPHLLPCLQPLTQPVVPPLYKHHTQSYTKIRQPPSGIAISIETPVDMSIVRSLG